MYGSVLSKLATQSDGLTPRVDWIKRAQHDVTHRAQNYVNVNIIHKGFKCELQARQDGERRLPLSTLPSVEAACTRGEVVMHTGLGEDSIEYEDWQLQHQTFGASCFMVCHCAVVQPSCAVAVTWPEADNALFVAHLMLSCRHQF